MELTGTVLNVVDFGAFIALDDEYIDGVGNRIGGGVVVVDLEAEQVLWD